MFIHLLHPSLVLFILSVLVSGSFSGGPGHIFLCGAPLCRVSGRYNLFDCWPGVGGGTVQVFFSGVVVVGTVRLK